MFFEALFLILWTSTPDVVILTKLIHYKRLLWFSTQLFIFLVRSNTLAKLCVWRSVQKNHFCVFDVCPTETAQWSVINILRQKQKLNLCPIAAFWRKANPVLCGFFFFFTAFGFFAGLPVELHRAWSKQHYKIFQSSKLIQIRNQVCQNLHP